MTYTKAQQLGKRKKKINKNFTPKIKKEIFERDDWKCVRCGSYWLEKVPHHITFKSQGGTGEKRNGVSICIDCHRLAHRSVDVRRWFEQWRDEHLDENGERID